MSNNTHPVAQLAAVENNLVRNVNAVAASLDQIGTTTLGEALAGLAVAAEQAKGRLASAMLFLQGTVAGVVASMEEMTDALVVDLEVNRVDAAALLPVRQELVVSADTTKPHKDGTSVERSTEVPSTPSNGLPLPSDATAELEAATVPAEPRVLADAATSEQAAELAVSIAACGPIEKTAPEADLTGSSGQPTSDKPATKPTRKRRPRS